MNRIAIVLVLSMLFVACDDEGGGDDPVDVIEACASEDVEIDEGSDEESDKEIEAEIAETQDDADLQDAPDEEEEPEELTSDLGDDEEPEIEDDLDQVEVEEEVDLAEVDEDVPTDVETDGGEGPFDDLDGLSGSALKAALFARIDGQVDLGYKGDGVCRELMFSIIDEQDGRIECIYTGRTVAAEDPNAYPVGDDLTLPEIDNTPETDCRYPDGSEVPGGCMFNTEHSWPRNSGANSAPAESDLHHLFPTWEVANGNRSNYSFGVTTCVADACEWHEGGSELGPRADNSTVFEVRPEYRGNIARAQFYFSLRYQRSIGTTVETTLRDWHASDPPDERERLRNDLVEEYQENRNPFVDRPDFVDRITDF